MNAERMAQALVIFWYRERRQKLAVVALLAGTWCLGVVAFIAIDPLVAQVSSHDAAESVDAGMWVDVYRPPVRVLDASPNTTVVVAVHDGGSLAVVAPAQGGLWTVADAAERRAHEAVALEQIAAPAPTSDSRWWRDILVFAALGTMMGVIVALLLGHAFLARILRQLERGTVGPAEEAVPTVAEMRNGTPTGTRPPGT